MTDLSIPFIVRIIYRHFQSWQGDSCISEELLAGEVLPHHWISESLRPSQFTHSIHIVQKDIEIQEKLSG